jgi:hypothetical protein
VRAMRSIELVVPSRRGTRSALGAMVAAVLVFFVLVSSSALAVTPRAGWEVTSRAYPTYLPPGGKGIVVVDLFNTGAGLSTGKVTVTDTLPPGLTATNAGPLEAFGLISEAIAEGLERNVEEDEVKGSTSGLGEELRAWNCSGTTVVSCTTRPGAEGVLPPHEHLLRPIVPGSYLRLGIEVQVAPSGGGTAPNSVTVSGGGAAEPAEASAPVTISNATPGFGFAGASSWFTNADGTPDTQAGSHPFEASFSFDLNQAGAVSAGGSLRDLTVALPPGLVGDPSVVPQCTRQQFLSNVVGGCPASTQIGVDRPNLPEPEGAPFVASVSVYNLVPPPGVPAQFGFTAEGVQVLLDAQVRSGSDYGITEDVKNLGFQPVGNVITLWGVPAEKVHDRERCGIVLNESLKEEGLCGQSSGGAAPKPLLTLPTSCGGPLTTTLRADTWQNANTTAEMSYLSQDQTGVPAGYSGCERLGFGPSLSVAPDTTFADTPAGLTVELKVPQEGLVAPEGLAMSNIKNTSVTLPEGVAINPGQATGLTACQASESGIGSDGPSSCPSASKVGIDEITTTLLKHKLEGNVYILQADPPNLKLLVVAEGEGVDIKLVGDVHLDEATGRLVTTFEKTPELPFTDFKLSFSGGARAALVTPTGCGAFSTTSDFTPWSSPFVEDVFPTSTFAIDHGPGGTACPGGVLAFSPSLIAGSTTDQAGGFTNFSMLLTRGDGQQRIDGLRFTAPPGLTGMLSNVPLCSNAQAEANACPEASKIGHTSVESGPGPYPLVVPEPGQPPAPVYLTEGYAGAPFGLSIVVPLHVGPFTLPTQRVRAKIEVDPNTAQLTVTTDPLPQVVAGVPTDLRAVDAVIEHPGFMINPTNCDTQAFTGTAYGTPPPGVGGPSSSAAISSHFQVGACQALKFTPKFAVSTSGKTSKANGASLTVKLAYPSMPQGSQTNLRKVKVELPKQLPSRLTTLQKACTAQQFHTNPAGCPAASIVGHARAITPVLPVPLEGPAYFVSNGGEAFPNLIMVLQGYGLTVQLTGNTFINKAGVTSSTFPAIPDQPVTSFELTLPQGPHSALAANGNLCTSKLITPNEFVGQNGATFTQNTRVTVTGCPKARVLTRAQKLALALKACHKKPKGGKRAACERAARKKYEPVVKRKAKK